MVDNEFECFVVIKDTTKLTLEFLLVVDSSFEKIIAKSLEKLVFDLAFF